MVDYSIHEAIFFQGSHFLITRLTDQINSPTICYRIFMLLQGGMMKLIAVTCMVLFSVAAFADVSDDFLRAVVEGNVEQHDH